MSRIFRLIAGRSDWVLALLLTSAALAEVGLGRSSLSWPVAVVFALTYTLPLVLRRQFPLLVHGFLGLSLLLLVWIDEDGEQIIGLLAFLISSYTTARELAEVPAWSGLGITLSTLWVGLLTQSGSGSDFIVATVLWGGSWVLGQAVRANAESAARAEHRERLIAAAERVRIARELHDVAAHSISVIAVLAQAVRRRLAPGQTVEREQLQEIEAAAREAMTEMRRILGALRTEGEGIQLDPQPGLAELPELIERTRSAGMPVTVEITGVPVSLPAGLDLAAYRVLQEALTNSLKHAGPAEVKVIIEYFPGSLRLQVDDTGQGANASQSAGAGLVGMRERVSLYGGTLVAASREGGGFRVTAMLPLSGPSI